MWLGWNIINGGKRWEKKGIIIISISAPVRLFPVLYHWRYWCTAYNLRLCTTDERDWHQWINRHPSADCHKRMGFRVTQPHTHPHPTTSFVVGLWKKPKIKTYGRVCVMTLWNSWQVGGDNHVLAYYLFISREDTPRGCFFVEWFGERDKTSTTTREEKLRHWLTNERAKLQDRDWIVSRRKQVKSRKDAYRPWRQHSHGATIHSKKKNITAFKFV